MNTETPSNFTNHFLIAMPNMDDALFGRSVIYVCEHSERGAMGLIINKPTDLKLSMLFEKVDMRLSRHDLSNHWVYAGGPVLPERGFVLHEPIEWPDAPEDESIYASTLSIPGGLEMTTSRDVLEALAHGAGPQKIFVSLGYASWDEGQLENEISDNAWLTVEADPHLIFETPTEQRWEKALSLLGLQPHRLLWQAGHG